MFSFDLQTSIKINVQFSLADIYRLDRLTSGVLIMGKTARKTKELENQVLHRHVRKEYIARVIGEFPEWVSLDLCGSLCCVKYNWSLVSETHFNLSVSVVKCQTLQQKVTGLIPGRRCGNFFFFRVNCVLTLIWICVPPLRYSSSTEKTLVNRASGRLQLNLQSTMTG